MCDSCVCGLNVDLCRSASGQCCTYSQITKDNGCEVRPAAFAACAYLCIYMMCSACCIIAKSAEVLITGSRTLCSRSSCISWHCCFADSTAEGHQAWLLQAFFWRRARLGTKSCHELLEKNTVSRHVVCVTAHIKC